MASFNLLLILFCLGCCLAEFTDHMQTYKENCLGEDKIHCADGSCVWQHQYCDGKVDCPDGSDENLCVDHTPEPDLCKPESHFLCTDKLKCIPNTWLCNNETDCTDGSDELNCPTASTEEPDVNSTCKGFTCKSDQRCISPLWACDGSYDCADHSDEGSETCHNLGYKRVERDQDCYYRQSISPDRDPNTKNRIWTYSCLNDSRCIYKKHMCNGIQDCKDGSDEGDFCQHWSEMCANHNCNTSESFCVPGRSGRRCECFLNYHAYNETSRSCEPVDSCDDARPQCSQVCELSKNKSSFFCHCSEGYYLDQLVIGYVCIASGPEPLLFFSTRNEIKYVTVRSRHIVTVASGIKQAHGVAFDGTNVYWVETALGHQAIVRAALHNITATKQVLVGLGLEDPGDISIDWKGGNFYFSDAQRGSISACQINGSMCVTVNTDARTPKHLTLDVPNSKMYWADWHDKPVIMSAYMDGSDAAVLVDRLDSFPTGLTVDSISGRLYFVDGELKGARLDDGRVFIVSKRRHMFHEPYAVAVFENVIYWSDFASNTIQAWDKLDGVSHGALATFDTPISGLHIYHPLLTPSGQFNSSPHVRLAGKNGTQAHCPEGMELDDEEICIPVKDHRTGYIVAGAGATFTLVQYSTLGGHDYTPVHFNMGRVQAMAYDSLRDVLYMFDVNWKTISYIPMSEFYSSSPKTLLFMGLNDVVDMDYDYITDNLYFADAGRKFIEVVSLKTGKRAIIHRFEDETPISMCVLPDYGKMLVAVTESEGGSIHIDSFGLDGSGRRHMLMTDLKGPTIRLKYSQQMDNVYLADEGNNIIDHIHPVGMARENYRTLSTSVTGLEVTDNLVVWTTRRSGLLYWADIHDTSRNIRRVQLLMFPNTTHLHIQATRPHPANVSHPCHADPCEDVCVQTPRQTQFLDTWVTDGEKELHSAPTGFKCLCPPGQLNVDGKCSELVICTEEEAFCHKSNVCVMRSSLCDGNKDCEHGEDEEGCPVSPPKCSVDEKLCADMCIHKNTECVLPATSTEKAATPTAPPACTNEQFECSPSLCIQRSQMCDGSLDCPDAADEASHLCDTLNCYHTEFMCSSGHCVPKTFVCDGEEDCTDGSDEYNCRNKTCPEGEYQCRNMDCVRMDRRCDGEPDCRDASDEDYCESYGFDTDFFQPIEFNVTEGPEPENCPEWEHTCELNRTICVPLTARCNGVLDCPGATDEANCKEKVCPEGYMSCRQENQCVPYKKLCDGHKDCVDGEDEVQAACNKVNKTGTLFPKHILFPREECHDGYFCQNGQCIEWRNVCDNQFDCSDGTDEGGKCLTACDNNTCSYSCKPTPIGNLCQCRPGYTLDTDLATCVDHDECVQGPCSQHCYNTQGSFVCSCHPGYALRPDRRSCKAVKGEMYLLCVAYNGVRNVKPNGMYTMANNVKDVLNITDIAYDVRRKELYVTAADDGKLVVIDGKRNEIVITNIGRPTHVAVDWITGLAYFADAAGRVLRMRVCTVRTRRCALLFELPLHSNMTALAVDPASHQLFYCLTQDLESVVWTATSAGLHLTHLHTAGYCTGLAVDSYRKRLYVAESGPGRLYSIDYQGRMYNDILTNDRHLHAPQYLNLFEDHIYYLDGNSLKLSRCLVFGKPHCESYLHNLFGINSFVIRHEATQRNDIPDFCEHSQCDNVCVNGDLVGICVCDDGTFSKNGSCPISSQEELPLFNGLVVRDVRVVQDQEPRVSVAWISILTVLFLACSCAFFYYHFVYKKRQGDRIDYSPVHFHNSAANIGESSLSSPPAVPTVQMPAFGARSREFENPLEFFRNLKLFKRDVRPVGTAGLQIDIPPQEDVSDTESDMDDKERRKIVKPN